MTPDRARPVQGQGHLQQQLDVAVRIAGAQQLDHDAAAPGADRQLDLALTNDPHASCLVAAGEQDGRGREGAHRAHRGQRGHVGRPQRRGLAAAHAPGHPRGVLDPRFRYAYGDGQQRGGPLGCWRGIPPEPHGTLLITG